MTDPRERIGPPGRSGPPERSGRRDAGEGALGRLRRRDEILQVLFWLEGEGFVADMTPSGIRRFLPWPEEELAAGLEDLVEAGFASRTELETRTEVDAGADVDAGAEVDARTPAPSPTEVDARSRRYELTPAGRQEGGRRFVEEFAPILSRDTHGGSECQDPDCGCHTSALGAAACRARGGGGGEEGAR